uniref:Carbonic anhydrase n=1 Tax=Corethrella appendiculata TaxID=1370023 RepID=U5ESR7_9DIPT
MKLYFLLKLILFVSIICKDNFVEAGYRFGYSKPEQRRWMRNHGSCAGKYQSPISIHSGRSISINMPAIEFVGYHNLLPGPIQIHNNGHSVTLSVPKREQETEDTLSSVPYIFGGKLTNQYVLEGLHYHWGYRNSRGSEHVLNDIRYPLEMHIIHRNKKYKNVAEALTYSDGLAVLAFFYQLKENDAPELSNIAKAMSIIENYNESILLNHTFTLASLIRGIDTDKFYTYKGSLTTPPCSEAVTWILFPDTLSVSVSQMHKFRQLSNGIEGSILVDNFRALQPLGNRRIFLRKVNAFNTKIDNDENQVHYSKWDWLI